MLVAPLLKAGWTLDDIKNHTRDEITVASVLLSRFKILEQGDIPRELAKEDPNADQAKLRYLDERDKLNV